MSHTRDEQAARWLLRNNIIGDGPNVNLGEISRRTGVPYSTVQRWNQDIRDNYAQQVSCPWASSFPSATAAEPQMLGQALGQALQPLKVHHGSPPVSALSTQPVLGDMHIFGPHLMRMRGRHLVVGSKRYPDLLRCRTMLYWETRWPHLILTRSVSVLVIVFMLSPHYFCPGCSVSRSSKANPAPSSRATSGGQRGREWEGGTE